jgi:hypothetical protein
MATNDEVIEKITSDKLTGIAKKIETHLHAANGKFSNIISQLTRGDRSWLTPERAHKLNTRLDETQSLINTVRSMINPRPSLPPSAG